MTIYKKKLVLSVLFLFVITYFYTCCLLQLEKQAYSQMLHPQFEVNYENMSKKGVQVIMINLPNTKIESSFWYFKSCDLYNTH